ncbi:SusC/RagA family TonB-linked outer membrane protein [Niastella yeongjuensis]|uniref:SusC/RagA family TonB-linked outer membrane protein n=1 Tax=Niastella yeongjuensis TaxID=354355 RepID=A0A1V9FCF8_9BACT|nr:SusC/RagA family TonB-linked outer membrane protein [Niastella yeongjuensis]OQP56055.1 SusC/RagA family TonB-linked outer membrane protein [Niastella yeongjuensis]SEP24272.1 iron complex outermembrane recepter protein [Niastella yeongjuensis]
MNIRLLFMVGVWLSCISYSRANIPTPDKYDQVVSREPVKGTVVGADGTPIAGATVRSLSSKHTTTTNEKGEFSLQVAEGEKLLISYVGFNDQELTVSGTSLQITMTVNNSRLSEVVVVGYGSRTKADVTGSLTQLKAENIRQGVNISVDNMLQGKVAGVRIAQSSGEPGAGVDVFIRGVGSIRSGSTPLFVVDGVPLANDNVSAAGADFGMGSSDAKNPLNFLNTSDIETITVLKDASAAAIYGARGSNGVVLITTKHGKKGDPSLTYDMYVGTSKVIKKMDILSADEYRNALVDKTKDYGGNTDWQDAILRNGFVQNHNVSFSKVTSTGSYAASLSHLDQNGIVEKSSFKRTTGRLNAEESFFDNKRLTVKMNLTASNIDETGIPNGNTAGSDGQVLMYALMANPTRPVRDSAGNFTNFKMIQEFNPLYVLSVYDDRTNTFRVLGNVEANLRLLPGLNYRFNLGVDKSTSERNTTMYPNNTDRSKNGVYAQNNLKSLTTLLEHYLTYNLAIQKHQVEVLGGFSYQKFQFSGTTYKMENLAAMGTGVPPMYNPGYSGTPASPTGFAQENELQSYFGRVNYNYDNRFLFTASVRADGSTRFGENNKYGYFPSFAGGWNLTRESFLENVSAIKSLKLRASWGQTGNQEVPNKITQASYSNSATTGYYLDGTALVNGVTVNRTANPNLKWEMVEQYNIGTDFELFKNKLYGSIEYYNKTTKDPILNLPSEPLSPTASIWKNVDAEIVNKGFEFTLGSQLINTKDLSWNVDVNGATVKNTVKDLPVSQLLSGSISGTGISNVNANIYRNGYAAGSFYMIKFLGYDKNGLETYEDYNGDGIIDAGDRQVLPGAIPKFSYGLNSQVRYKTLDLAVAFIGQTGGYLFNNTALDLGINNLSTDRNLLKKYVDMNASLKNLPAMSSLYLEKSDFFRCSNLRLGNTFTFKQIPWMQSLNVYVSAGNLFTITKYSGYDPLVNTTKNVDGNQSLGVDYTTYPSTKTFLVGATIKF